MKKEGLFSFLFEITGVKKREKKRFRRLGMEPLESRELLSVTPESTVYAVPLPMESETLEWSSIEVTGDPGEQGTAILLETVLPHEEDTGYYSIRFAIPDTTQIVYLSGLSLDNYQYVVDNLTGADRQTFINTYFIDAEKGDASRDSNLCWAATASNMLYQSGWANDELSTPFLNEDDVLEYFSQLGYWSDTGGNILNGVQWFLNGSSARNGGNFYPDILASSLSNSITIDSAGKITEALSKLESGCVTGLSVDWYQENSGTELTVRDGGHAITLYGYIYDTTKEMSDPDRICSLIVADSDDNKFNGRDAINKYVTYAISWDTVNDKYIFDSYKSGSLYGWLDSIDWLEPNTLINRLPELARPTISSLAPVENTSDSISITFNTVEYASSYTIEYSSRSDFSQSTTIQKENAGSWTISGLQDDTIWYFRVRANGDLVNYKSSSWSMVKSVRTPLETTKLEQPTISAVLAKDLHEIDITIGESANAQGYIVAYSTDPTFPAASSFSWTSAGDHSLYGLTANTNYYVRVKAVGNGYDLTDSDWVVWNSTVTTLPGTVQQEVPSLCVTTLSDVVDSFDGLISLREALYQYATVGNTITFDSKLQGGTIALSYEFSTMGTPLYLQNSMVINAANLKNSDGTPGLTIDANQTGRAYNFYGSSSSDITVKLDSLEIIHGKESANKASAGAIRAQYCHLSLVDSIIRDNEIVITSDSSIEAQGGAIYVIYGSLSIDNSVFENNRVEVNSAITSSVAGGVVALHHGTLSILDSQFSANTVSARSSNDNVTVRGGLVYGNQMSSVSIADSLFCNTEILLDTSSSNSGGSGLSSMVNGGALYLKMADTSSVVQMDRSQILNTELNVYVQAESQFAYARVYGSGLYVDGSLEMTNSLIVGSVVTVSALSNAVASGFYVSYAEIFGNAAYVTGNTVISSCTFTRNEGILSNAEKMDICGTIGLKSDNELILVNSIIVDNSFKKSNFYHHDVEIYKPIGYNNLSDSNDWDENSQGNLDYNESLPLFEDAVLGDYRLSHNSQAQDRGNLAAWELLSPDKEMIDLAGNSRNVGGAIDIGAYEDTTGIFQPLPFAPSFTLTAVSGSCILLQLDTLSLANAYSVLWRIAENANWMSMLITDERDLYFSGLTPSTRYEFKVIATGDNNIYGQSDWSEIKSVTTGTQSDPETPSLMVTTPYDIVDSADNLISLREAVDYSKSNPSLGRRITFASELSGHVLTLAAGEMTVSDSLVIDASSLDNSLTISAAGHSRIFNVTDAVDSFSLVGLNLTNGYSMAEGGALISLANSLSISKCTFSNNQSVGNSLGGGAVYASGNSLVISDSCFLANLVDSTSIYSGPGGGGAVFYSGLSGSIVGSLFHENTFNSSNDTFAGGAIYLAAGTASSPVLIDGCYFEDNVSYQNGGAVASTCFLLIADSDFVSNRAMGFGGALWQHDLAGNLEVQQSAFQNNQGKYGGAFYGGGSFTHVIFQSNYAERGGGLYTIRNTELVNTLIVGNYTRSDSFSYGGGIFRSMNSLILRQCTVADNSAVATTDSVGGGLYTSQDSGETYFYNSIIVNNLAGRGENYGDISYGGMDRQPIAYHTLSGYQWWKNDPDAPSGTQYNNSVYKKSDSLFANDDNYTLAASAVNAIDQGNNTYATDEYDLTGASRIYHNTVDLGAYEFQGTTRLDAPLLLVNEDETTSNSLSLEIDSVPLLIEYSTRCDFTQDTTGTVSLNDWGDCMLDGLLPNTVYYIRARATGTSAAENSIWSDISVAQTSPVALDAPQLSIVSIDRSRSAVKLDWSSVPSAMNYLVEYCESEDFTSSMIYSVTYDSACSPLITGISTDGFVYFRMVARGIGNYSTSAYSDVVSANLGPVLEVTQIYQNSFTKPQTGDGVKVAQLSVEFLTSYSFVLSDPQYFKMEGNDLVLTQSLPIENYSTTIYACDIDNAHRKTNTVSVAITVVSSAPTDIVMNPATPEIWPNIDAGQLVATLSAVDVDSNESHTWSIQSGSNEYSLVDSRLYTKKTLNGGQSYPVTIRVTDQAGNTFDKTFPLTTVPAPVATCETDSIEIDYGCDFYLTGSGTPSSDASPISGYYWDIDGDGQYVKMEKTIRVPFSQLRFTGDTSSVSFLVKDEKGAQSVPCSVSVKAIAVDPIIYVQQKVLANRVLILDFNSNLMPGETITNWNINWKSNVSGSEMSESRELKSSSASFFTCYDLEQSGTFIISLSIETTLDRTYTFDVADFVISDTLAAETIPERMADDPIASTSSLPSDKLFTDSAMDFLWDPILDDLTSARKKRSLHKIL